LKKRYQRNANKKGEVIDPIFKERKRERDITFKQSYERERESGLLIFSE